MRCDFSQEYIQDLSLGWVNVLARMNVRPNAQAYKHNHPKNIRKNFTNYVII